ncbi:MAG: M48 family metalloprotease [Treponema sp.]|jgi:predicted Zn-dependent protease|nr:M48 family metalloprotease [Treponema sp.]
MNIPGASVKRALLFAVCILTVTRLFAAGAQGKAEEVRATRGNAADALGNMEEALAKQEEDFSPEDEYFLGRSVSAVILERYRLYTANPGLTAYLNKICSTLVINSPSPGLYNGYYVMILDSPEINAFASTGGHIFVTLGMVRIAGGEDMLAAVIAHEIGHIQLRHSMQMITEGRLYREMSAAAERARSLANRADTQRLFDNSVRETVNTILVNGYSRAQEFDADAFAAELLTAAGYEPSGLIDTLRLLDQNQPASAGGINKTHPSPQLRISNAEKNIAEYARYGREDTGRFRTDRFDRTVKTGGR